MRAVLLMALCGAAMVAALHSDVDVDADVNAGAELDADAAAALAVDAEAEAEAAADTMADAAADAEAEMHAVPMGKAYGASPVAVPLAASRAWYGHGGWMGFGGAMVSNAQWMGILHDLMPAVAAAIVKKGDVAGVIKGLENNPVCAAFGYEYYGLKRHAVVSQPFEWDSFFHPQATAQTPMVEQSLVAHGSPLNLFVESAWKSNAYGAVARTAQTDLGGVTAVQWRDLFVKAIRRARNIASTAPVTWKEFGALFPSGRFRVILDIKTGVHQASQQFLASVVREWAARYVDVVGVGTFNWNQNNGLKALTGGKTAEVWFFHGLYDRGVPLLRQPQLLDVAATADGLKKLAGKTVLFNGGFLLRYQRTGVNWFGLAPNTKQASYQVDAQAVEQLRSLRRRVPTMNLGIYVQEYDIDVVALSKLNALMNKETAVFNAGFAWGGKDTSYYADIQPTPTDATVGTNGQILFAKVNYL